MSSAFMRDLFIYFFFFPPTMKTQKSKNTLHSMNQLAQVFCILTNACLPATVCMFMMYVYTVNVNVYHKYFLDIYIKLSMIVYYVLNFIKITWMEEIYGSFWIEEMKEKSKIH